ATLHKGRFIQIGIPLERRAGEKRVAATPDTVKKLVAAGHQVMVEEGAGANAHYTDAAYAGAGATLVARDAAFGAAVVLKVRAPDTDELALMKRGTVLIGMLDPFDAEGLTRLNAAGLTAFALEAAPRTSRAQVLDVLSSQANVAGYKAVLLATEHY